MDTHGSGEEPISERLVLKRIPYRKTRVPGPINFWWQIFPEKMGDPNSMAEFEALIKERSALGHNIDEDIDEALSWILTYTSRQSSLKFAFEKLESSAARRDCMHHRLPRGSSYRGVKTYVRQENPTFRRKPSTPAHSSSSCASSSFPPRYDFSRIKINV